MKTTVLALSLLTASVFAQTPETKPTGTPPSNARVSIATTAKPDLANTIRDRLEGEGAAMNELRRERDELKAQLAQLQQQNQYLAVLAERNELAVRVVQRDLVDAQAKVAQLQGELSAAKAETTKAREQLLGLEGVK